MALQLTGAFKRDALPNLQVRLPAVVIGGGLTGDRHGDRADGVLPDAGREDARPLRGARAPSSARRACAAMLRRRGAASILDEFLGARPRGAGRARARRGGRRGARLRRRWCAAWGGVTLAYRKRMAGFAGLPPEPRRGRSRRSRKASRFAENLNPVEAVPDEHGAREGDDVHAQGAGRASERVELPARTVLVAAGTSPNVTYEKEHPGTFQLDASRSSSRASRVASKRRRRRASRSSPTPNGFFTSYNTRRPVRHLLRRQPPALRRQRRQGDGVGQGRLSARRRAVRRRARARSIRDAQPRARRGVAARSSRTLDDELARARRATSCG